MPDARWKAHEREVARLLGGKRQPNTGKGSPDVVAPPFAVEVKTVKHLPPWLSDAMTQAWANANGLLPLLVLVEVSQGKKAKRYAVLDFEDFAVFVRAAGHLGAPSGETQKV